MKHDPGFLGWVPGWVLHVDVGVDRSVEEGIADVVLGGREPELEGYRGYESKGPDLGGGAERLVEVHPLSLFKPVNNESGFEQYYFALVVSLDVVGPSACYRFPVGWAEHSFERAVDVDALQFSGLGLVVFVSVLVYLHLLPVLGGGGVVVV